MTEPLILQARAKAGIDDVRQALTDPKALNLWLGEHSNVDLPGTSSSGAATSPRATRRTSESSGTTARR